MDSYVIKRTNNICLDEAIEESFDYSLTNLIVFRNFPEKITMKNFSINNEKYNIYIEHV